MNKRCRACGEQIDVKETAIFCPMCGAAELVDADITEKPLEQNLQLKREEQTEQSKPLEQNLQLKKSPKAKRGIKIALKSFNNNNSEHESRFMYKDNELFCKILIFIFYCILFAGVAALGWLLGLGLFA